MFAAFIAFYYSLTFKFNVRESDVIDDSYSPLAQQLSKDVVCHMFVLSLARSLGAWRRFFRMWSFLKDKGSLVTITGQVHLTQIDAGQVHLLHLVRCKDHETCASVLSAHTLASRCVRSRNRYFYSCYMHRNMFASSL